MKKPYVAVEAKVLLKADSDEEKQLLEWIVRKIEEEEQPGLKEETAD